MLRQGHSSARLSGRDAKIAEYDDPQENDYFDADTDKTQQVRVDVAMLQEFTYARTASAVDIPVGKQKNYGAENLEDVGHAGFDICLLSKLRCSEFQCRSSLAF